MLRSSVQQYRIACRVIYYRWWFIGRVLYAAVWANVPAEERFTRPDGMVLASCNPMHVDMPCSRVSHIDNVSIIGKVRHHILNVLL